MRVDPLTVPSSKRVLISLNMELGALYDQYRPYYKYGNLTEFEKLVLVLEDRRYFSHSGVDPKSLLREVIRAVLGRRHGGASTIDMQFIRTVNARRELTYRRKIRELILAVVIQFHFDKKAMLRSYLAIAFFGSGLTGSVEASQAFFGTWPENLTREQASQLAAMLVYPKPLVAGEKWFNRINRRARYGLKMLPRFEERFDKVDMAENVEV